MESNSLKLFGNKYSFSMKTIRRKTLNQPIVVEILGDEIHEKTKHTHVSPEIQDQSHNNNIYSTEFVE